jgi:hypothetical protein
MMRTVLFFAIAIFCASCRTDAQLDPIQTTSIVEAAEISTQEDCLYREVARLMEPKGSPPSSLHYIAVTATRFCSEAARTRFQRASAPDAERLARDYQIKTEHRAFSIGLELREKARNMGVAALKPPRKISIEARTNEPKSHSDDSSSRLPTE